MRSASSPSCSHGLGVALLLMFALAAAGCDDGGGDASPGGADAAAADATPDPGATVDASDPAADLLQCLADHCSTELGDCANDPECAGWLRCNQACDPDDRLLCPTICGWYYQSPKIAPFAQCIFDYECVVQDYSEFPACDAPEVQPTDLSGLDGTWWLTRHVSEDYALTSDCQKLVWEEISPSAIDVVATAPLTLEGTERVCQLEGTYRLNDDGSIRTEYTTSYVDYFEKWTLVHKSENTFLVDICFSSPGETLRKYGTWLITRMPVEDLSDDEYAALDSAATAALGYGIADMATVSMSDCPNE